jgi:hypothetical protein
MPFNFLNRTTGLNRITGSFERSQSYSSASGTTNTPGNGYTYYTFTSPDTVSYSSTQGYQPSRSRVLKSSISSAPTTVEVFMVGGGGYGASGGGGGAGALVYRTSVPAPPSPFPVTVGSGGVYDPNNFFSGPSGPFPPQIGSSSSALGFTAAGGGHGGAHSQNGINGATGASGGGGAPRNGGGATGSGGGATSASGGSGGSVSPPVGWGNAGSAGSRSNPGAYSGGGGGAGGAGGPGENTNNGGGGLAYPAFAGPLIGIPGLPGTYARGGHRSGDPENINAQDYSGNGGGGATPTANKGIVIFRHPV